jgi:hypothetical protein
VFAAPPVADFIISGNATNVGQTVNFSSTATDPDNDIATLEWDFNYDGSFVVDATGPNASTSYDAAGPYSVALRVIDGTVGDGTVDTSLKVKTVTVGLPNTNPIADDFSWQPAGEPIGAVPDERQSVAFHGSGHDPDAPPDPITYEWDFGDGDTATGQTPAHAFDQAGSYSVSLRVRDNRGGLSDSTTKTVHVNAQPVAAPPVGVPRPVPPLQVLPGVLVEGRFLVFPRYTRIRYLRVRAPADSTMRVRCLGRGCPKRVTKESTGSKKLRFKKLERRFRPGTRLIVSVTKSGFIGRQTSWTIRHRKAPVRRDGCLAPGAKEASACPGG